MAAIPAAKREARAGFEADGIWDLGFQGAEMLEVVLPRCSSSSCGRGSDAILPRVQSQAFRQLHGVGAGQGSAQAFYGREDLLVEVPVYVRHQGAGCVADFLWREGAFGGGFGGGDGGGGRGGGDVGDYVVNADGFAGGEGAEGDLDLGHGVGVWVVAGVFAEFLGGRIS